MSGQFISAVNEKFLTAGIGLNRQMLPVFLGLLFAAAIAWLYLSRRLYGLLREEHPAIYQALGRPRPFISGKMSTNFRIMAFLFRRSYEATVDVQLIRLAKGLRCILFIYLVCFAGSLLLLLDRIL